ncbi:MAG: putative glutamine ABC transporter permease protein GlnM [Alphaproteobacteria bacterium MarineAlpha2_Bin1]|nr:MAG: putative glutamine ABC transporter permease protein GlnM [Alphaproteobacteria bacterium MarineAlpha2_Bin1]
MPKFSAHEYVKNIKIILSLSNNSQSKRSLTKIFADERIRSFLSQLIIAVFIILIGVFFISNTTHNLNERGLEPGFGFLFDPAFFDIGQRLIDYNSQSSFGRAMLVGLLNTLLVSILGIILATVIGFTAGILRLSNNWLVSRLITSYVEFTRNVPVLLQIIFWWSILTGLPKVRESINFGEVIFLNNRGIRIPSPILETNFNWIILVFILSIICAFFLYLWSKNRQNKTGKTFPILIVNFFIILVPIIVMFNFIDNSLSWEIPKKTRFNFRGGFNVTPELVALWWALSTYTGAFISEIVRSGILSVSKGQTEAANSLGLKKSVITRKIIMPQALRVIIPPLTSQYLNLTKNSSLAIAIGYQDFVSVGGTILNQSGQAIEVVAIWMIVYLSLSLGTSFLMNIYNKRIALIER